MEICDSTHSHTAKTDASPNQEPVKRTPGLWAFDAALYPVLTHLGVFTISVAATYLTSRGGDLNAAGKPIFGKFGQWMQKRGDVLINKLETTFGMTRKQADMAKMVTFSFVDGSLMAPVVKVFEDRRETLAKKLDEKFGTLPENDDVYKAEPKQSWSSVLAGRLATCSIVVPTAVALNQKMPNGIILNDYLFNNPGEKWGEALAKKPSFAKLASKIHLPELTRIAAFETFYTAICTAGVYVCSRCLARWFTGKKEEQQPAGQPEAIASAPKAPSSPAENTRKLRMDAPEETVLKPKLSRDALRSKPAIAAANLFAERPRDAHGLALGN